MAVLRTRGSGPDLPLLSLEEWQASNRDPNAHGVLLESHEEAAALAEDAAALQLIAIRFPRFADGRPYTTAHLLRQRHGYGGELRAVGDVLIDQYAFLRGVGFDAFEVPDGTDPEAWEGALTQIPLSYQDRRFTQGSKPSILHRRHDAKAQRPGGRDEEVAALRAQYGDRDGPQLLKAFIKEAMPGRIALVSSFGAEAATLLHMASEIDRHLPVIFIDTGRLFQETLDYRDELIELFGLTDVRTVGPTQASADRLDPDKQLYSTDPNACCYFRKVEPLNRALAGFDGWITGRKRFHGGGRSSLPLIERADGRIKINPLATWSREAIEAYRVINELPEHPLVQDGYLSIGCIPCTSPVGEGEDLRTGRWRGQSKTECGIHEQQATDRG